MWPLLQSISFARPKLCAHLHLRYNGRVRSRLSFQLTDYLLGRAFMADATFKQPAFTKRLLPTWFDEAKLGIFVHWGLYSVPGWAPRTGQPAEVIAREGWQAWLKKNPYAEWYANTIRLPNTPSQLYHAQTYGADFPYEEFAPRFNATSAGWDPGSWAGLFKRAGARYVVLTTKHHDGFLLWPSRHPNPNQPGYRAERDLVGELTQAVRAAGLRMGLYYSGGLDWTFEPGPIGDPVQMLLAIPQSREYVEYARCHYLELIERYAPSVLWNDIGYPASADLDGLFAEYYRQVPDGVVNDRFSQASVGRLRSLVAARPVRAIVSAVARRAVARAGSLSMDSLRMPKQHFDFKTSEYSSSATIVERKWESTRGLGFSFGYNRNETAETLLSGEELVRLLVDVVSKKGNLLLNVGPMADGSIPEAQAQRLLQLGRWLTVNGEAIFGTQPWRQAEGSTEVGLPMRFTQRNGSLYAVLLARPQCDQLAFQLATDEQVHSVTLLGYAGQLQWRQADGVLSFDWPADAAGSEAYTLKLSFDSPVAGMPAA
jgi:alpha-L-fucosidase